MKYHHLIYCEFKPSLVPPKNAIYCTIYSRWIHKKVRDDWFKKMNSIVDPQKLTVVGRLVWAAFQDEPNPTKVTCAFGSKNCHLFFERNCWHVATTPNVRADRSRLSTPCDAPLLRLGGRWNRRVPSKYIFLIVEWSILNCTQLFVREKSSKKYEKQIGETSTWKTQFNKTWHGNSKL